VKLLLSRVEKIQTAFFLKIFTQNPNQWQVFCFKISAQIFEALASANRALAQSASAELFGERERWF
jgi:hypothetical protein